MASRRGHRRSGLWDSPLDADYAAYYSSPPSSPYDPYGYTAHYGSYGGGGSSISGASTASSNHTNNSGYYFATPRVYSNTNTNTNSSSSKMNPAEVRLRAQQLAAPSPEDGELPDILIFKCQNESWSFEFPAFSVDDGRLHVSDIRRLAGQTLKIADASRIKLMYKGRLMNNDDASAKSQGLKQFSEVVAVVMPGYTEGVYGGSSNMIDGWREAQLIPVSDSEDEDEEEQQQPPSSSLPPPPPPLPSRPQPQLRPQKVEVQAPVPVLDEDESEDERYYYKPSPVRRGRSPPKQARQERRKSVRRERKPRDPSPVSPDRKPRRKSKQRPSPVQPVQQQPQPVREPATPKETITPREKTHARQARPPSPPRYTYIYPTVPPYPSPPPTYDPLPNICREPRPYATSHPSPSVSSTVSSSTYTSDSTSTTSASTAASTPPSVTTPTSIPSSKPKPKQKPKPNKAYVVPNRPPTPCPPFLASHSPADMLAIFEKHVTGKLVPLCTEFIMHPPADVRLINKEQRRLNEAMERVLARADEITVGSSRPLRDRRKAAVQMVQRFQTRIDAMIVPE
ncbi:hypothetical protein MGYG_01124 [Nannizzia gypsea CBS 118893]|uniref:BAG domain-containing protein n=1 Tax=Arthroderma gypseum (strain ATCC MYA-4604 / CBS 118893) TaxID=535722 RepID=E5QYW4_ARTGP|nr:hypothetical protein MGYG_01124 [Nannizzia gypsea CBS 118893]EFQ98087.1 hypothetical protein MGYG_01124 [Nannizzia gypsea CBS 118893]